MKKILVIGAAGQVGSELTLALREQYGKDNVIASDLKTNPGEKLRDSGKFEVLDCTDAAAIEDIASRHSVDTIYHLAAILSAVAEAKPALAWKVNIDGLYNVLEVARVHKCSVFVPSSIAAFGPGTPLDNTPQETTQRPTSMYGVTKVSGELLCDYYFKRFGVDCRGLRYPGIVSNDTLPGGGTTDYAVEIYYDAVRTGKYKCFLKAGTHLPMMYMPDAIKAAIDLMEADPTHLIHRNAFNVTAMSIDPEMIAAEIKKHIPKFCMEYDIDPVRQGLADSWPRQIDDSAARQEWGWKPKFTLEEMTKDMIDVLTAKLKGQPLRQ